MWKWRVAVAVWCALGASAVSAREILRVCVTQANFRERPSTDAQIAFRASRDYPVEVIGQRGEWSHIRDFEGDEAWVARRLLDRTRTVAVVVQRGNLRTAPQLAAAVVAKVLRGHVFQVSRRQGRWLKVANASYGLSGWLRDDLVWGAIPPASAETVAERTSPR